MAEVSSKGYEISYQSDGVYLAVLPSDVYLAKVDETEVITLIRKKKIQNYNASLVGDVVKKREGKPVKIADAQQEQSVASHVEVVTSQDKMRAFVVLTAPEGSGAVPAFEDIIRALHEKGIVFGTNEAEIRQLVGSPVYNQSIPIAEGAMPQNGKNGEVKYFVDLSKDRKPVIMEDGTVNYKDMNLIENVTKGQKLAELVPPVKGINGKNVVGTELKASDGKQVSLPRGRGVAFSPDNQALISELDGQLMVVDGKISVFSNYEAMADIDNSTGNIKFVGNVCVRGNVLSGFEIEAGGDIQVDGVVEGALLKAGGNITLKRGMHGGGKGMLIAGGDVISKYIESCNVEVKGDLKAEAIMHCDIKCGNSIVLGGKKGLLVGGTAKVGRLVDVKVLGSQMSTTTIVEVGVDPHLRERLKFLKQDIGNMEDGLLKANQAIILLNKLKSVGELSLEKREILAKSTRAKYFYENKVMEYKKEIAEIEEKLQQGANGRIRVSGSIYPGTRVAIGNSMMYIKQEAQHCTLYSDGADIRFGPL